MKVLSLFDGMACGMLAFKGIGVDVERYVAYEIDKYAIKVSTHNFPMIEQRGDVFKADFTEFEGFDAVVGGSPCTYWSIAQKKDIRETEAHGIGWELFQQYVRAIREAKPKFFIYENNKSMASAIKEEISRAFGFEPIMINSALVSAQNRQRYYWVGIRQEDGTYKKADIEQPIDRGIVLRDVLDDYQMSHVQMDAELIPVNPTVEGEKARTLMAGYYKFGMATMVTNEGFKGGATGVAEPVNATSDGKTHTIKAQYFRNSIANFVTNGGFGATGVAEPVAGRIVGHRINEEGHRDDYNEDLEYVQRYEVNQNPQKANCLTTVQKDNMVAEPVAKGIVIGGGDFGEPRKALTNDKAYCLLANPPSDMTPRVIQSKDDEDAEPVAIAYRTRENDDGSKSKRYEANGAKSNCITTVPTDSMVAEPIGSVGNMYGKGQNGQLFGLDSKTKTLSAGTGQTGRGIGSNNSPKAILPVEVRGMSFELAECNNKDEGVIAKLDMQGTYKMLTRVYSSGGKSPTITAGGGGNIEPKVFSDTTKVVSSTPTPHYIVKDGMITIKGKSYPIKLPDGEYIIRKLTVSECKRLQTVPEDYDMSVISNSQAYKCLGNGWTVDVISHLIDSVLDELNSQ